MEINKRYSGGVVELAVAGRLDGYWSDHLANALDEEIRLGSHHVRLDLSEVMFLSSAGIGMLVRFYKSLNSIQGSLSIAKASDRVRKVIEICGLQNVLFAAPASQDECISRALRPVGKVERAGTIFEIHELDSSAGLTCKLIGNPSLLQKCGFAKQDCRAVEFPDSSFGIGLGAIGENFEECQNRFGEFIAVAGAVAYRPTDGSNIPDYLVAAGEPRPEVHVCYGVSAEAVTAGLFSKVVRFYSQQGNRAVTLSDLVESCVVFAGSSRIGVVVLAEAAGLMGAALRRSPTITGEPYAPFEFPHIREWLTFTAERAHTRSMTLIAGIAAHDDLGQLAPMLRPLCFSEEHGRISGHFHAAAFSYGPLQQGKIDLKTTVKKLFDGQTLENVLHLLCDDRAIAGAGQSELIRGACWIGPIREIVFEESAA